jgi:hypothetical protein
MRGKRFFVVIRISLIKRLRIRSMVIYKADFKWGEREFAPLSWLLFNAFLVAILLPELTQPPF